MPVVKLEINRLAEADILPNSTTLLAGPEPKNIGGGLLVEPGCVLGLDKDTRLEYPHEGHDYVVVIYPQENRPRVHITDLTLGSTKRESITDKPLDFEVFAVSLLQV